jgi:competence ComEA-like helix-hairpin-helix protein
MTHGRHTTGSLLLMFLIGTLFGVSITACVKLPHRSHASPLALAPALKEERAASPININTASVEELEKLPGIGRSLAGRIISYRQQYGRFRRPEHLMMVRGIGERRFRRLRPYIIAG